MGVVVLVKRVVCNGMVKVIPVIFVVCDVKVGDSGSCPENGNWVREIFSDTLSS